MDALDVCGISIRLEKNRNEMIVQPQPHRMGSNE